MSENVILWIFGAVIMAISALIGKLFADNGKLYDRISALENQNEKRITRIETMIEVMGISAAKILHSPHDPFGLDKYLDLYIDRNFEMTAREWEEVLIKCETIVNDKEQTHGYRFAAAFLGGICHHKLAHDPILAQKLVDSLRK